MPLLSILNLLVFFLLGFVPFQSPTTGGLKFHGSELPINERTSYNVFSDYEAEFAQQFSIEFDLSLYPETEIGYIFRIKNRKNDRIFNLFFDGQGHNLVFKFNEEGKSNLITASIERGKLLNKQWFEMSLVFDLSTDSIKLEIDGESYEASDQNLPDSYHPIILFGKSDHLIDVPSFAIKELSVAGDNSYFFPLLENQGNLVHDLQGKTFGQVINPNWLKNYAFYWNKKTSFHSQSIAGANFNPQTKEIYYYNRDSLWKYNVRAEQTQVHIFQQKTPVELILGTNFIDTLQNKLYTYEVYYDSPYEGPTVASLDLNTLQWSPESDEQLPTQLHHHGSFIDSNNGNYGIFGGFGNMKYSKNFFSFDLEENSWKVIEGFEGDKISPRYFSSIGYQPEKNRLFILGGMGNESGEQSVGRQYYYDLYQVDLNAKKVTKLWEIAWDNDNMVPVRNMIVTDSSLFTLCYPEHFSESSLRLYQFSIADGSFEVLGDSIPIKSDKITTNANLYFDKGLNNLYAVIQEFEDDISSDLKVYSLAFPAITKSDLFSFPQQKAELPSLWIVVIGGSAIFGFVLFRYIKNQSSPKKTEESMDSELMVTVKRESETPPNSLFLFGNFMVRDRKNRDITYMFSAQLKQVFCLILQHSITEEGITSLHLSNQLWPDKPADKVKNSRGVTINNLRKTLSELDGIELIHEKGHYKIVFHEEAYCDYLRCLQLMETRQMEIHRDEFAEIVSRGKFLYLSDDPLFDLFKEEAETKLEPVLALELENSFSNESYQTTLSLAEALFHIDPLNETALIYQIKSLKKLLQIEKSKIAYRTFALEYKRVTRKDFHLTYSEIIAG